MLKEGTEKPHRVQVTISLTFSKTAGLEIGQLSALFSRMLVHFFFFNSELNSTVLCHFSLLYCCIPCKSNSVAFL